MKDMQNAERAASLILRAKDFARRYKQREGEKDRAFLILGGLREQEKRTGRPITITEMARHSGLAVPNVSRLFKPYEEAGLLRREKQGRTVHIAITPQGEALLAKRKEIFLQELSAALGTLSEQEQDVFLTCGEKLLARLEGSAQEGIRGGAGC